MNYDDNSVKLSWEIICNQIKIFQNNIDYNKEVALLISNLGQPITLRLKDIGFFNPYFISFKGTTDKDDIENCQVIQHISQVNFLLTSVPRPNSHNSAYRIPF